MFGKLWEWFMALIAWVVSKFKRSSDVSQEAAVEAEASPVAQVAQVAQAAAEVVEAMNTTQEAAVSSE
jgi:hypothetical protein